MNIHVFMFKGSGAAWTKLHRPVKVKKIIKGCDRYDEDKMVKKLMAKYGIDKVRGGRYSQIIL